MSTQADRSRRDRARGAFWGLALGDALGMPTQSMTPDEIAQDYGRITGFLDAGPRQRIAAGMPAGSITDDTEQAVLLGRLLLDGGGSVDQQVFAARLLEWQRRMQAGGSLDLLGPSTSRALRALQQGVPAAEAGRGGSTNGAAMRITPVGIAVRAAESGTLLDAVVAASALTHNTSLGIGAAAAVAGAVSAGVDGGTLPEAIGAAVSAAAAGERRARWVAGGSVAARLRWAVPYLAATDDAQRDAALTTVIGTSVAAQESVVAALALASCCAERDQAWPTLCRAAGLGGDTDTVAAMAGAVLGAVHGVSAWPAAALAQLRRVNDLDLDPLVDGLLTLRSVEGSPA